MNPGRRRELAALGGVAALAVVVFVSSLWNEFTYDDVQVIVEREEMHSLANWRSLLTSGWWNNALYRPLTKISLALDWTLGGGRPWIFHLVNVLAHAAVTAGVWLLARPWLGLVGATVAGALFAVHPVHVEAVAGVVGRAEIYAALCAVAAAIAYRKDGALAAAGESGRARAASSVGTLVAVAAGLASKESAFAIPGVLLFVDWIDGVRAGSTLDARLRGHVVLWLATVALAVEWLLLRAVILGDIAGDDPGPGLYGEGFVGRLVIMAPVVWHYLRLFLLPLHLSADYSPNQIAVDDGLTLAGVAGVALVVALVALALRMRKQAPVVTFGLTWIGGTLLIVSNLVVPTGVLLAERSMYLPSIGVVLVIGYIARQAAASHRVATWAVTAGVVVLASVRVVTRIPVWRNNDTFFPRLVTDAPRSFRAQWVLGQLLYIDNRPREGEIMLRRALDTYPLFANTWQDFGRQLQIQERWAEAGTAYRIAFRLEPDRLYDAAAAISNFVRAGMLDSAEAVADSARAIDPHEPSVLAAMAGIAYEKDRPIEAMTLRRQAAWLQPDNPYFRYLTGLAAVRASYCPELVRSVDRLETIAPDYEGTLALQDSLQLGPCAVDALP